MEDNLIEIEYYEQEFESVMLYGAYIKHKGLNEIKVVCTKTKSNGRSLESLINVCIYQFKEEYLKKQVELFKELDTILIHYLESDITLDFESYKAKSDFDNPKPQSTLDIYLTQQSTCWDWDRESKYYIECYEFKKQKYKQIDSDAFKKWGIEKAESILKEKKHKEHFQRIKTGYENRELRTISEYCSLVLNQSLYPDFFPKTFEIDYKPDTKILIVEYTLPALEDFPTLKEIKKVSYKLREYYASETQMQKIFENTLYNVTLRTIYELFTADKIDAIDAISFNGWVNAINKATGKKVNNCILSIQVKKSEFLDIDLRHVDPKICFKNLKGVGSSRLSGMIPIQPIMQISKNDKRFTSHYDVADNMDDSTNLAAMDWEDFEHLIREVFGKEFSSNGGEVKVTQASRDGGVDAIAFDPDPIRGGKIIIQAKRYTNTVGVSAVRDLYGTVMNEGANKGILVTTADYGPDAYEFVKGKPLTLMNGANLLYLLEKHGHKAKIDIAEARRLMQ